MEALPTLVLASSAPAINLPALVQNLGDLLGLVGSTPASALLSTLGLILICVAALSLYKLMHTKPEETSGLFKVIAAFSLLTGVIFSAAGPAVILLDLLDSPIRTVSKAIAFDNLEKNKRVKWLIRLIPYDPLRQEELSVSKLKSIGPQGVKYTFVGSYEELKGRKVSDALALVGQLYRPRQRVSAIIFSVSYDEYPILPASTRGLLQAISDIESDQALQISRPLLAGDTLSATEKQDLASRDKIESWSFNSYKNFYKSYCDKSHRFRCDDSYDARKYISDINSDWHPVGAAVRYTEDVCRSNAYCSLTNWDEVKAQTYKGFGARIFFIPNLEIAKLHDRYLVDFENPTEQLIPEIGMRDPS
jgi:hypothetical protein